MRTNSTGNAYEGGRGLKSQKSCGCTMMHIILLTRTKISMASRTGQVSQRPSSFGSGKNIPKSKMTLPITCEEHGPEMRQWFSSLSTESGECLEISVYVKYT